MTSRMLPTVIRGRTNQRRSWSRSKAATYGDVQSMSPESAMREVDMSVTVLARSLRGSHSITTALEGRASCTLWLASQPDAQGNVLGFKALRPIRESFVSARTGSLAFRGHVPQCVVRRGGDNALIRSATDASPRPRTTHDPIPLQRPSQRSESAEWA